MDLTQIYKIDNFLQPKELENFTIITREHYNWRLSNTSYDDSRLFWFKDLWAGLIKEERAKEIEATFRARVQYLFNIETETIELYMNGQTHSQSGKMHSDEKEDWDPNSQYITLVYYAHPEWNIEWGGFTAVETKEGMHINYPQPNTAILFDSRLKHVALEPTVHCPAMRITLAHKMKITKG